MKELEELQSKLEQEKAAEMKRLAPLEAKREALVAKIQPLEAELHVINKQIRKESGRLAEVSQGLAELARARMRKGRAAR